MKEKIIGTLVIIVVFIVIGLISDRYYAMRIKKAQEKLDDIMSDAEYKELENKLKQKDVGEVLQ